MNISIFFIFFLLIVLRLCMKLSTDKFIMEMINSGAYS